MKGIAIIAYTKSPGAFIEREFPSDLSQSLKYEPADVMNLYALIRTKNMFPNFLYVTNRGIPVAAYYTGFDFRHYIGRPDYIVAVFLDKGDNPDPLENQLRQIARDLLPRHEEEMFPEVLQEAFKDLKAGLIRGIGPEEEIKEADAYQRTKVSEREGGSSGSSRTTLKPGEKGEIGRVEVPQVIQKGVGQLLAQSMDDITTQFKSMELEESKNRVKDLEAKLKKKETEVRELKEKLLIKVEGASATQINEVVGKLKSEYEPILAQKDEEINQWKTKVAEINERAHIAEASITSMNDIVMSTQNELQEQGRTIGKLRKQLEEHEASQAGNSVKDQEIKSLQEKIRQVSEEMNEKNKNLEAIEGKLQEQNREIDKLQQATKAVPVFDSSKYDIQIQALTDQVKLAEEEIRKRNGRMEEMKVEIIELKKNNKIQRREIETLQSKSHGISSPKV